MEITEIDMTTSTLVSQYKSKLSLYELARLILEITVFDER